MPSCVCLHCGTSFSRKLSRADTARYCSLACRIAAKQARVEHLCEYCGQAFTVSESPSRQGRGRYCSKRCLGLSQQRRVDLVCAQCGKTFWFHACYVARGQGHYCSPQCRTDGLTKPLAERFWAKVDRSGGPDACWPWLAARNASGHGVFSINRDGQWVNFPAQTMAYELTYGMMLPGFQGNHRPGCEGPWCVQPAHIYPGTQAENVQDMIAAGDMRGNFTSAQTRGEHNTHARLTVAQVLEIRQSTWTVYRLAKHYGVSRRTIQHILAFHTWKDLISA